MNPTTITRRNSIDPDLPDWTVWLLDHRLLLTLLAVEIVAIGGLLR